MLLSYPSDAKPSSTMEVGLTEAINHLSIYNLWQELRDKNNTQLQIVQHPQAAANSELAEVL